MTSFEKEWHDKYMDNLAAQATLEILIAAGKLSREMVDEWISECMQKYWF